MNTHTTASSCPFLHTLFLKGTVIAFLSSCAVPEPEKLPVVNTSGSHSVAIGATVKITATTTNATDPSYSFVSASPAIASIDHGGIITGVAFGETSIKITGSSSKATATHAIVVIDQRSAGDGGASVDSDGGQRPAGVSAAEIPFYTAWQGSAHADRTSVPFSNWNKQGAVPATCARCHASEGFVDFLGGDGSPPGQVDSEAPIQSEIRCITCHNRAPSP